MNEEKNGHLNCDSNFQWCYCFDFQVILSYSVMFELITTSVIYVCNKKTQQSYFHYKNVYSLKKLEVKTTALLLSLW